MLPNGIVVRDIAENFRRQYEEAAIDRLTLGGGLFEKFGHLALNNAKRAETSRRRHRCHRRVPALLAMVGDRGRDIDIRQAITVGETEGLIAAPPRLDALYAPAGLRLIAGFHQCHMPRADLRMAELGSALAEVDL